MKLDAKRVQEIFLDSLFKEGESREGAVICEGIVTNAGFNPIRLQSHKNEIIELLNELPETFFIRSGQGGWSFLMAAQDKHGNHWGEHRNMEQLFLLGIGIKRVQCLAPKEMWCVLPGGVPYYAIHDEDLSEDVLGSSRQA